DKLLNLCGNGLADGRDFKQSRDTLPAINICNIFQQARNGICSPVVCPGLELGIVAIFDFSQKADVAHGLGKLCVLYQTAVIGATSFLTFICKTRITIIAVIAQKTVMMIAF